MRHHDAGWGLGGVRTLGENGTDFNRGLHLHAGRRIQASVTSRIFPRGQPRLFSTGVEFTGGKRVAGGKKVPGVAHSARGLAAPRKAGSPEQHADFSGAESPSGGKKKHTWTSGAFPSAVRARTNFRDCWFPHPHFEGLGRLRDSRGRHRMDEARGRNGNVCNADQSRGPVIFGVAPGPRM